VTLTLIESVSNNSGHFFLNICQTISLARQTKR
jgi:hypothetical protein